MSIEIKLKDALNMKAINYIDCTQEKKKVN